MLGGAGILVFYASSSLHNHNLYHFLVVPPFFVTMLVVSMISLQYASLGSIIAIRNMSPLVCLPLEHWLVAPQNLSPKRIAGLVCVLCGCVAYVWHDMDTSIVGVVLVTINMLVSVCDRLLQRHLLTSTAEARHTLLFVNNFVGGVLVLAMALVTREDIEAALLNTHARWPWVMSVGAGLLIGYASVRAQEVVNATTHLLITNLSRILTLELGSLLLGEHIRWMQWLAASVSVGGTILYAL